MRVPGAIEKVSSLLFSKFSVKSEVYSPAVSLFRAHRRSRAMVVVGGKRGGDQEEGGKGEFGELVRGFEGVLSDEMCVDFEDPRSRDEV